MSSTFEILISQLNYLFTTITLINVLDILLVAAFFFVIFQALYQTRAMQLLRGAIIIAILGISLVLILPLGTFTLLLQGVLIAGLISLPILFQDELRRALTGLGQIGTRRSNGTPYDQLKSTLADSIILLSQRRHGALIVLEGKTPLDDIIETGIAMGAERITQELITTIFFPNTALHDGAVVLRGDRLMAAACILPVEKEQTETEHLGTRHRAALRLSFKIPDAMVIVVSEETGNISVAQDGRIYRGMSNTDIEDWLDRFQHQIESQPRVRWNWLRSGGPRIILTNLIVALALSIVAWVAVTIQTNPPEPVAITDVPLVVIPPPPDIIVTSELPENVQVIAQTSRDQISQQDRSSVTAELDLAGLSSGAHQVPVEVTFADPGVQLISVAPSNVNVSLEQQISRELTPTPEIIDPGSLPVGYTLGGISTTPETVLVQGQESLVSKVVQAQIIIELNGRREDFQAVSTVLLLDQDGEIVEGLTPSPQQVVANVEIEQTFVTRETAIEATIDSDTLDENYQLTSVRLDPSTVTLAGDQLGLAEVGEFIVTVPIDLSGVSSEITVEAPLILPEGVTAINDQGVEIITTLVKITVEPVSGYLSLTRWIEEIGLDASLIARLSESRISVLLFGPQPLLDEIVSDPSLVTVYINLEGLSAGTYTLPIEYLAPQDVIVELFPSETEAVLVEKP